MTTFPQSLSAEIVVCLTSEAYDPENSIVPLVILSGGAVVVFCVFTSIYTEIIFVEHHRHDL